MCSRLLPRLSTPFFAANAGDLRVVRIRCAGEAVAGGSEELVEVWALQHWWGWFVAHRFCAGHNENHPEVDFTFEWLGDCFFRCPGYCFAPGFDFLA